jgi:hypothetical protein
MTNVVCTVGFKRNVCSTDPKRAEPTYHIILLHAL